MKKLFYSLAVILLFSNQITKAQCGHKKVTEFYPEDTEVLYTYPNTVKFQDGTTGHIKEMRPEITSVWWAEWFCKNNPKVLFDYWGCEECSDFTGTGFIVLKKGNISVVIFNYNNVPYVIFNAKVLPNQWDYQQKLNPDLYNGTAVSRGNKEKFFQSLQIQFESKELVALTTKNLELYFK